MLSTVHHTDVRRREMFSSVNDILLFWEEKCLAVLTMLLEKYSSITYTLIYREKDV